MNLRWCLTALLAAAPAAQTYLYVDPVAGIDQPGRGTSGAPFKTLTFAVTQAAPVGQTTFTLRAGTYDNASGETFPIPLPDVCAVVADPALRLGARQVRIETPLDLRTTFALTPTVALAFHAFKNLHLGGGQFRAVQLTVQNPATTRSRIVMEDCTVGQSRAIAANLLTPCQLDVVGTRCEFRAPDRPLSVTSVTGSLVIVDFTQSLFAGGQNGGIVLDAQAGGAIWCALRGCRVEGQTRAGLQALSDQGGIVSVVVDYSLFHGIGLRVIGGTPGALLESVGPTGVAPLFRIQNSLFVDNRNDAPAAPAANYTFGVNLVGQANLAGAGGNLVVRPALVDAIRGDFHLLPGSAGIDLGTGGPPATDWDGDPRLAPQAGPADLGPDEFFDLAVYANDDVVLGQGFTLRTMGPANVPFAVVVATARTGNGSFGPGQVHLVPPIHDLGLAGVIDARGLGQVAFPVPNLPELIGAALFWQGVYAQAPYLGTNAYGSVVRAQ